MTTTAATISKIRHIGSNARGVFIDRDELIDALEVCFVSGEHAIVLGPPGTGKSACIRYFAESMDLPFFRRVLNPDLPREDLVGPIDPLALKEGRWDRSWAGMAVSPIVFLDEIGKASAQVQNLFLDAMEERKVASGNVDKDIPLHVVVAASNETIDTESPAIWDRFSVRLVVERISDTNDFVRLLSDAWGAMNPPTIKIDLADLQALRAQCLQMASVAVKDAAVKLAVTKMWRGIASHVATPPSDRRWLRLLILASARALLDGRDKVSVSDLSIGKLVLWYDIDDIAPLAEFIDDLLEEEKRELRASEQVVEAMEATAASMADGSANLETIARTLYRAGQLSGEIAQRIGTNGHDAEWKALQDRLNRAMDSLRSVAS